MSETHQLTELQIAILRVLWDRGRATVAEIQEALRAERGLALTTVATLLSRLEKRGVVRHSMVHELTERLFDGDVAEMMSHLLTGREISPGDLERIKAMLDQQAMRKEADSNAR
jgi:BlaI family transcriptional regulator, penicillinase repressor